MQMFLKSATTPSTADFQQFVHLLPRSGYISDPSDSDGMPRKTSRRWVVPLATTASAMMILLLLYEFVKQVIFPEITVWQSHFMTIFFGSGMALIVAFFVLRSQEQFYYI